MKGEKGAPKTMLNDKEHVSNEVQEQMIEKDMDFNHQMLFDPIVVIYVNLWPNQRHKT